MFVWSLQKRKLAALLLAAGALLVCAVFWMNGLVVSADAQPEIPLPILMYHSVLKDAHRSNKYVVTPDQLEKDLAYLQQNGYTTVFVQDLIGYVYEGAPLPEKPVMLSFDDGYYNNYTYVLPLLEKYDMKAVISVVGSYAQRFSDTPDPNPNYAYLSWEDIRALKDSGRVEIQNHSYDMHKQTGRNGAQKKAGESVDAYRAALGEDAMALQAALRENCDILPTAFTYPFGAYSKESLPILKELGFRATLTCTEKVNYITRDPECLFGLHRFNRPSGISTQTFMHKALPEQGELVK